MILSFVAIIGIAVGSITIPLGGFGSFSLGAAGGVLLAALILSYVGQIGPVNFRMEDKSLGIMYQMGLTFFMAVVGLRYGYDVVMSLMGSGLSLAIAAIFVEAISSTGSEEPTAGYGAAQPFAILANVLLATLFFHFFL